MSSWFVSSMKKLVLAAAVAAVWLLVLGVPRVAEAGFTLHTIDNFDNGGAAEFYVGNGDNEGEVLILISDETGYIHTFAVLHLDNPNPEGDHDGGGASKKDVQDMANLVKLTGGGEEMSLEQAFDDTALGQFLKQAVDEQSHSLVHVYLPSDIAKVSSPGRGSQAGYGDEEGLKKSGNRVSPSLSFGAAQLIENQGKAPVLETSGQFSYPIGNIDSFHNCESE